jgi:allantoin racemase
MFGMAERLAAALGGDVPVIDPISAAVSEAAQMIRLGLTHSKRTFPKPTRL